MKINWGTGIAALYLGFVAMILLLVSMSIGQKIDLVTEHYYEEELAYQGKIDKKHNAKALGKPLVWEVQEQGIKISYPENVDEKALSGQVKLYCPSNDKNDRTFSVRSENHAQFIPTSSVPAGNYHLQIDWKHKDQAYYNEDVIVISHINP
jgi:nitrogen fixation protein FixH